jgi:hypothetical protein
MAMGLVHDDPPKREDIIDALHDACENGYVPIAKWLYEAWSLETGDLCTRGRRGIHGACKRGHTGIIVWMLTVDDSSIGNDDFDTPEVLESLSRQPGLAMWLVSKIPALQPKISF